MLYSEIASHVQLPRSIHIGKMNEIFQNIEVISSSFTENSIIGLTLPIQLLKPINYLLFIIITLLLLLLLLLLSLRKQAQLPFMN